MLILIAHGSHDPRWRASVERLAESLQADLGQNKVGLAYMECTPPTLMDVASEAVRAGETELRVLPLFMTGEGHVDRDIDPLVEQLRRSLPSIEVQRLPPVGQHPAFLGLLRRIALDEAE